MNHTHTPFLKGDGVMADVRAAVFSRATATFQFDAFYVSWESSYSSKFFEFFKSLQLPELKMVANNCFQIRFGKPKP
jgi:hypothetical protein